MNARLLASPSLRGWNRYTVNLARELARAGVEIILFADRPVHPAHLAAIGETGVTTRIAPPMRYLAWEQRWLPRQCAMEAVSLLHCPINFGLPWRSPCPTVLTLHDAIFELSVRYSWKLAWLTARYYHWAARRAADRIITVSNHAKGDLVAHLGVPASLIDVIWNAADERFFVPVSLPARTAVSAKYEIPKSYIFYVGGWEKRKNLPLLLEAFRRAMPSSQDTWLVLAGGREAESAQFLAAAQAIGIENRIRLLPFVDDADLPALYQGALGFVYPSQYEGFGLQLCEAMASGCPTLASRRASLPEVLGDGGETFETTNADELTRLLSRLITDSAWRSELIARARMRATAFDWRRTAEATLRCYERALADKVIS